MPRAWWLGGLPSMAASMFLNVVLFAGRRYLGVCGLLRVTCFKRFWGFVSAAVTCGEFSRWRGGVGRGLFLVTGDFMFWVQII